LENPYKTMTKYWAFFLVWPAILTASPFSNELKSRALRYFVEHTHPTSGLTRDRAVNGAETPDTRPYGMASIAATGFGLATLAAAGESGTIPKAEAIERVGRTLRFVTTELERFHGWLYHFVDWKTGKRWEGSEISTIDTALFIAGALSAAYRLNSPELIRLAERLLADLDFSAMLAPNGTLTMGYFPELGFIPYYWDSYAEHLVLILLGLGHPQKPLPKSAWTAWARPISDGIIARDLPLFVHQYSHCFVDLKRIATEKENFFENSVKATHYHRELAKFHADKSLTFGAGFWGLSAGDSPLGYLPYSPSFFDGTVCPGCTGGSAMFVPEITDDLEKWARHETLWGRYGFADGINLDKRWVGPDVIGITVGALYLSLANLETAQPKIPAIEQGLELVNSISRAVAP